MRTAAFERRSSQMVPRGAGTPPGRTRWPSVVISVLMREVRRRLMRLCICFFFLTSGRPGCSTGRVSLLSASSLAGAEAASGDEMTEEAHAVASGSLLQARPWKGGAGRNRGGVAPAISAAVEGCRRETIGC